MNLSELRNAWEAHRAGPFPAEARGQEIDGVDLVLLDAVAAGAIQFFVDSGTLDRLRVEALAGAIESLEDGVPRLSGEAATYFAQLLGLAREVMRRAAPV